MRPLLFLILGLPVLVSAGEIAQPQKKDPWGTWEWTLESGYLVNVGNNTDIDYEIAPTQLTLRLPAHWTVWQNDEGARVVFRPRYSLLMESIIEGPEDYYLGANASPSIEYWFPNRETSIFFSIGGGIGVTNSTDIEGGQGQDFTLNWFTHLGIRQAISENTSILAGAYFIHHSNGGQTDPNPGIDALGATIGIGWQF